MSRLSLSGMTAYLVASLAFLPPLTLPTPHSRQSTSRQTSRLLSSGSKTTEADFDIVALAATKNLA
jgi:hypothetical protein